ncbi:hypothetical protein OG912_08890 [Streptomyces sp. NBC_00464]|uniref:hypothetical protein n=1 Tax=Streptomyces sp. NBC_00464 TaxID=2975751 RepID=UPI002E19671D
MTNQGRSPGAVLCIVVAMISLLTAVILSAIALDAASKVSGKAFDDSSSASIHFEESRCDADRDDPLDRPFMKCLSEYEAANQQGSVLWEREIAKRQAAIQTKGNLAVIFGLAAVTFAVCGMGAGRARRPEPQTTNGPGA